MKEFTKERSNNFVLFSDGEHENWEKNLIRNSLVKEEGSNYRLGDSWESSIQAEDRPTPVSYTVRGCHAATPRASRSASLEHAIRAEPRFTDTMQLG